LSATDRGCDLWCALQIFSITRGMLVQEAIAKNFCGGRTWSMGLPRPDGERGVYGISVTAELIGTGVQNLRLYEARGLLEPERTEGGTRRYSANDLDRLRRISDLLEAGLNLAGIGMVLDLETQNTQLRAEKEDQQWLKTASIPPARSSKRTSSNKQTPLTLQLLNDTLIDNGSASVSSDSPADLVGEADRPEQQTPVLGEDDDYPRGPSGAGWS